MELSIVAAKILALTYLSAGIAALSGKMTYSKLVEDFGKSSGLTFVSGFFTIVLGVLLVEYHNLWVKNWTVLITIIGWMSLLKGVLLIAFPDVLLSFKGRYKNTRLWGFVMVALGILFGYFGFIQ